jgi:hypothetical protein
VRLVRDRDLHRCVVCGTTGPLSTQHRVARGMGGTRAAWVNLPANLLTVCGSGTTGCHGHIEHHPEEAKRLGRALSRFTLEGGAEHVPVFTWRGWLLLDNEGGATRWEDGEGTDGHETVSGLWH